MKSSSQFSLARIGLSALALLLMLAASIFVLREVSAATFGKIVESRVGQLIERIAPRSVKPKPAPISAAGTSAARVVSALMFATITVTDTSGGTGGPGCKLRDAITSANTDTATGGCPAGSGADVIQLPTDATITLNTQDNFLYGPNGLPPISSTITIQGNGATIARDGAALKFRLFYVSSGLSNLAAGNLTLIGLTLSGGLAKGGDSLIGGGGAGMGGAIFNQGTLAL